VFVYLSCLLPFQHHKILGSNGHNVNEMQISQIIVWICFSLLSIMWVRYYFAKNSIFEIPRSEKQPSNERILAILPFRNEESVINKSLQRVISEISSNKNCKLILVNSASDDNSVDIVMKTIRESYLNSDMWSLIHVDVPGKGIALNKAMLNYEKGDIIVMIDADVQIPKGTFETFRELMSNEEIGAISGQESILPNHPMANYKTRSNKIRIFESSAGHCPILEGSLLAWSPSRIEWSSFDEGTNADDAQIAFCTIRSGHRSHVTNELQFCSLRDPKKASFMRSIRRSQGLNKQLLQNIDLLWNKRSRRFRSTMLFNILLHIIIPWCVITLLFAPLVFIQNPQLILNSINLLSFSPSFLIVISLLTNSGRTLLLGSLASILGQCRALLRIRSSHWGPGEG